MGKKSLPFFAFKHETHGTTARGRGDVDGNNGRVRCDIQINAFFKMSGGAVLGTLFIVLKFAKPNKNYFFHA